jgi:hypothetical protein
VSEICQVKLAQQVVGDDSGKEIAMEGPLSFFLFFFVFVPFILINATNYIKERRKADEELQEILRENNNLLKQILERTQSS